MAHRLVHVVRAHRQVHEHFLDAGQPHEEVPRGEPEGASALLADAEDAVEDLGPFLVTLLGGGGVVGDDGGLDPGDVALIADLNVEVARDDAVVRIGAGDVHILVDAKARVADAVGLH